MLSLAPLRSRLQALRWARRTVRWGCAWSQLVVCLLASWFLAFLLDWGLALSWASRAFLLGVWGLAGAWYLSTRLVPRLRQTEELEEVALLVERRQHIDSDLIAALQFESAPAGSQGSPRLTSAVVDYVAAFSRDLNVFDGFSWQPLPRNLAYAAASVLAALTVTAMYPAHTAAFWSRFWLGHAHYPTRTVIHQLELNGQILPVYSPRPVQLRLPQGEPLRIVAVCSGDIPETGRVELRGSPSGTTAVWTMKPDGAPRGTGPEAPTTGPSHSADTPTTPTQLFRTEPLPLLESLRLRVWLGDAVSDPFDIVAIPWPVVELRWQLHGPAYARHDHPEIPSGARQFAVLAGSRLSLELECLNKRLQRAELVIGSQRYSLQAVTQGSRTVWTAPPQTPLDHILAPVAFEIAVVDEDGLTPKPPVQGLIRLRPDRVPRVTANLVSRKVLPTAKPRLRYSAADDFGLARVLLRIEVTPAQGTPRSEERIVWTRRDSDQPPLTLRDEVLVDLAPLQLHKGDQVQITLVAEDDRGPAPPQSASSEPCLLEITDRSGILAELLESDQQSARQLDAIILRELGIGGKE